MVEQRVEQRAEQAHRSRADHGDASAPGTPAPARRARPPGPDPAGVAVDGVSKVFGRDPETVLRRLAAGEPADRVFEETGATAAVFDASFSVAPGEIFVVMGLSGSGKSTLLRMLNGLVEPTAGRVWLAGLELTALPAAERVLLRRRHTAMVFQHFALLPHRTVLENAAFGLEVAGAERRERRRRALAALETVGLAGHADVLPEELSGGMQQRVGLARALAVDPEILLMDEAFSALDPLIRTQMQDELLRLQRERPRTVVFISHDPDEALRLGDRIAVMDRGRIVQQGPAAELLEAPAGDVVRQFFARVRGAPEAAG